MSHISSKQLRDGLIAATGDFPTAAENATQGLPLNKLYVPPSHRKALSPEHPLVVGMRGAGKTYWWRNLQDEKARSLVFGADRTTLECKPGFSNTKETDPLEAPTKSVLANLKQNGFSAQAVWRSVMCWHIPTLRELMPKSSWQDRINWCQGNAELVEQKLYQADQHYTAENRTLLVLFDALDATSDDPQERQFWLKGLFQVLLEFRGFRKLRAKAFVRSDLIRDPALFAFPDGSKLQYDHVMLDWPRSDLYALLWQALANTPDHDGDRFRAWSQEIITGIRWQEHEGVWAVADNLRSDEDMQRELFHAIAGPWMGKDPRRGFPYTYLPNHLGDAFRKVSPRSFMEAIKKAAEMTEEKHPQHEFALHYEDIKRGVQHASTIRVGDLQQEYDWIKDAMEPLRIARLVLPSAPEDIQQIWQLAGEPDRLDDLIELGILEASRDKKRLSMPDVYRVGYGLGLRGGIRPVR